MNNSCHEYHKSLYSFLETSNLLRHITVAQLMTLFNTKLQLSLCGGSVSVQTLMIGRMHQH